MTKDAVVLNTFNNGTALCAVIRGTACGANCGSCEACIFQNEVKVNAQNHVHAVKGQHVEIESKNSDIFRAELLVYIIPLLCLLAGYIIPAAVGLKESLCIIIAFALLIISVAVVTVSQKNKPGIKYSIVRIKND